MQVSLRYVYQSIFMKNSFKLMMKSIGLSFLVVLNFPQSVAAQTECDSLRQNLQQWEQMGNKDSIANAHNDLSVYYAYRDADSCRFHCMAGLKYADKNKEMPYMDLLMNLGNYYNSTGESNQCVKTYRLVWQEALRLHCSAARKGEILSNIGVGYRRMNQPDSAMAKYMEALSYLEQCPAQEVLDEKTFLLTNIAILYANTSRVSEAEIYIRQALKYLPQTEDIETYFYVSNTAGAILSILKKNDEAQSIMLGAIERAKAAQMPRFVLQGVPPLLQLYLRTGQLEALNQCIAEMEPWVKQFPPQSNEVLGFYEQLGQVKAEMGQWEESNHYFKLMLKYHSVNAQMPLKNIHLALARNYGKLKQPQRAMEHYERAVAVMDSVYGTALDEQMSAFSTRFDLQAKQVEIARLAESNEKQKSRLIIGVSFSVFLLLAWLALYVYGCFRRRRLLQESELEQARSFINGLEQERSRLAGELHDGVCSHILGIGMMVKMGRMDETRQSEVCKELNAIHQDVRSISHELMPPKLQYAALHEVAADFLAHLHSSEMEVTFRCQGEEKLWKTLSQDISFNVYRILQELMSNIVRHAEATHTVVNMSVTEQVVEMVITNDGKCFDVSQVENGGVGMATLYERARIIHAQLDMEAEEGKQLFRLIVHRH